MLTGEWLLCNTLNYQCSLYEQTGAEHYLFITSANIGDARELRHNWAMCHAARLHGSTDGQHLSTCASADKPPNEQLQNRRHKHAGGHQHRRNALVTTGQPDEAGFAFNNLIEAYFLNTLT
jgi:hypothetical protein